jgi:hypothetical protein
MGDCGMRISSHRPVIAVCCFSVVLVAQDLKIALNRMAQETESLQKQIQGSDSDWGADVIRSFTSLKQGLQRTPSQPGKIDQAAASDLFNGLFGISKYIVKPNSVGKEKYAQLCHEVLKVMFDSGFQPVKVYCPAADSLYNADAAARPKPVWPDLSDQHLTFRDGAALLPREIASEARVPGILGQLYAGRLDNVADDLNTRNYIASLISRYVDQCSEYDTPSNAYAMIHYFAYYEAKANDKLMNKAKANNVPGFVQAYGEAMRSVTEHGDHGGFEDGNLMIRHYRCGGREAHLLFDNVLNLAQERNTIPPDVPNNAFYRAQVNPALRFPMDYLTADALSAQMRSLRKSCEGTMTDLSASTVVGKGQEGYCRFQAQMVVTGGVPAFEIASIEAKFSRDALIALEKRYPSYSKLQANCLQ